MVKRRKVVVAAAPADGGYRFEWHERASSSFQPALLQVVHQYWSDLQCDRGNDEYWNQVLADAAAPPETLEQPFLFVVLMKRSDNDKVVGFAVLRRGKLCHAPRTRRSRPVCTYPVRSWYVEFVCTARNQGYGRTFMTELHRRALQLGVEYITLSALPEVIMFYHNLGYKLTLNARGVEHPRLSAVADQVRQEIQRRKHAGERLPSNVDEMLAEAPFNALLVESLRQHLSSVELRGDTATTARERAEDGVYMVLCLPRHHMELGVSHVFRQLPVPSQPQALDDDAYFLSQIQK